MAGPFPRRRTRNRGGLIAVILLLAAGCTVATNASDASSGTATPRATPAASSPPISVTRLWTAAIGPLFADGLDYGHSCTASVIDSPAGNLLLAAAHCLDGSEAGAVFVPGYDRGQMPYGSYQVERVWVDPAWLADADPHHDYAVLQVRAQTAGTRQVQQVTGGFTLGAAPAAGVSIKVAGYVQGSGDAPISCTAPVQLTDDFPGFRCPGFAPGVSGSPLVLASSPVDVASGSDGTVVGLIGGLYQGGCDADYSFSPPFTTTGIGALLTRAEAGGPGDSLTHSGRDDC